MMGILNYHGFIKTVDMSRYKDFPRSFNVVIHPPINWNIKPTNPITEVRKLTFYLDKIRELNGQLVEFYKIGGE